ncbi:MAG: antibiotic biosynthesis monooxygenase [Chloroflexi bacterium]|nr:antibiotic biosynthesis monooxygenase [Chloroflexota bacterium]
MSVAIVLRLWAQPGMVDDLTRLLGALAVPGAGVPTMRPVAPLFQRLGHPHEFLYVGTWESRAALAEQLRCRRHGETAATIVEDGALYVCRELVSTSVPGRRPDAVGAWIVSAPSGRQGRLEAFLRAWTETRLRTRPGFVAFGLYQDAADESRFILAHQWHSMDDLFALWQCEGPALDDRLAELGALGVRFTGMASPSAAESCCVA